MRTRHFALFGTMCLAILSGRGAFADPAAQPAPAMQDDRAKHRFPQPVKAGLLPGRMLLQPREDQPVLGYVEEVVRRPDGGADLVVRLSGWLGLGWFGTRLVAVHTEVVALLGEHVAAMDIKPEALDALPTYEDRSAPKIGPDETLMIGIVKPFHT